MPLTEYLYIDSARLDAYFDYRLGRHLTGYSALRLLSDDVEMGIRERLELASEEQVKPAMWNPIRLFVKLGAKVSPSRSIRCLYRIRATINDPASEYAVVTIGYPIFIEAANGRGSA